MHRLADPLTPRELQVVKLVAEAHTSEQIAQLLVHQPQDRRAPSREHDGASSAMRDRVELTRYAIKRGLVEP